MHPSWVKRKCSIKNCHNRKSRNIPGNTSQRSYHRFPKDAERRAAWTAFTGQGPEWKPNTASFVCSDHFHHEDFQRQHSDDRCRLKETAIPTRRPKTDKSVELLKRKASSHTSNESDTGNILEKSLSVVFPRAPQFLEVEIAPDNEPVDEIFTLDVLKSSLPRLNPPSEWKIFADSSFVMFFRIDEFSAEITYAVTVSLDLVPKIRVRNRLYTGNQFGHTPLQDLGSLRGLLYSINGASVCSGCDTNRSCLLIYKGPAHLCPPCQTLKRMNNICVTAFYPRYNVSKEPDIPDVENAGTSCTGSSGKGMLQEVEELDQDQPASPASATSDAVDPKKRRSGKKLAASDLSLLRATDELQPYRAPYRKMITIWQKISRRVSEKGAVRSPKYCRDRLVHLLRKYRAAKSATGDGQNRKSTEEQELLLSIDAAEEEGTRMTDAQKERATQVQALIDKLTSTEKSHRVEGQSRDDQWEDDSTAWNGEFLSSQSPIAGNTHRTPRKKGKFHTTLPENNPVEPISQPLQLVQLVLADEATESNDVHVAGRLGAFDVNVLAWQLAEEERKEKKKNKEKHRCDLCGYELLSITYLSDHIRSAHPEQAAEWIHECLLCDKKFPSQVSLTFHNRNKHKNAPVTVLPTDIEAAIEHMKSTQTYSYYCRTCCRHYHTKSLFDLDQLQHTLGDAADDRPERDCPACDFHAPSFTDLIAHVVEHSLGRSDPKPCLLCGKFSTILKNHLRSHHPAEMKRIQADWPDQCDECGEKFKSNQSLACHRKKVHDDLQCLYCEKICYTTAEFGDHVTEHEVDEVYPCPLCDRTYPGYSQVRKHFRDNHDANHSNFCPICRSVIPARQPLSKHMAVCNGQCQPKHASVRLADKWRDVAKGQRLPCDDCGKLYASVDSMRTHIHRVHFGHWKESVEKQRKRQTERRRLGLIKKYKRKKKLRLAEFPFRCMECRSGFLTEARLDRHNARQHEGRNTMD